MGRPPAALFVARHGLRLDAADKQWHLTSPTPYDPPLTYTGWLQAKSLGVRIGNLIRDMVAEEEAAQKQLLDDQGKRKRKRKKYKVVLHSSPFLRCIQTSIAISAGLAQDSTPFGTSQPVERPPSPPILSPRTRPTVPDSKDACLPSPKTVPIRKSVLRLDAFLSEWLSPGYFELITPPPESVMMLASAKADLLRREDYNSYPNFGHNAHSASVGHLWNSGSRTSSIASASAPSESLDSISSTLHRSISISSQSSLSRTPPQSLPSEASGYVSPVPHWAVNPKHTIPPGYVSHARDACVDIDYQWDSTRSPFDWGDGGSFPEEWTDMHRRFRKGVQHLVDWYSTAENPTEMVTKTASRFARPSIEVMGDLDEEDVETEAIVVMVSHGAGCNALIGAISHQPVLMDVAMASLTMAVRKPTLDSPEDKSSNGSHSRGWMSPERKADSTPVHQLYELKIFASTDHLRSPPPTPAVTRSPSVASVVNNSRGRYIPSLASSLSNFTFNEGPTLHRSSSASPALSGFRRGAESSSLPASKLAFNMTNSNGGSTGGINVGSGVTSFSSKPFTLSRTPSIGLWSPVSQRDGSVDDDDDDDPMLLNFSHEKITPLAAPEPIDLTPQVVTPRPLAGEGYFSLDSSKLGTCGAEETKGSGPTTSSATLTETSQEASSANNDVRGLWASAPKPIDDADLLRDTTPSKRRWTCTERT
ncbi:hypothetical protein QBC34DRAFT_222112 [Podospora aff. communis PSN243]|uniref:Phosphoglycerate mutase n=1 Tax=Podospora aff. communis PSN243 TaxID=3040156 RepID=A0AAV9G4N4_9PEZI|nr:hypothetical protein QBC34DRAFT_222112 [Podospora aff. communis PSN243]